MFHKFESGENQLCRPCAANHWFWTHSEMGCESNAHSWRLRRVRQLRVGTKLCFFFINLIKSPNSTFILHKKCYFASLGLLNFRSGSKRSMRMLLTFFRHSALRSPRRMTTRACAINEKRVLHLSLRNDFPEIKVSFPFLRVLCAKYVIFRDLPHSIVASDILPLYLLCWLVYG